MMAEYLYCLSVGIAEQLDAVSYAVPLQTVLGICVHSNICWLGRQIGAVGLFEDIKGLRKNAEACPKLFPALTSCSYLQWMLPTF